MQYDSKILQNCPGYQFLDMSSDKTRTGFFHFSSRKSSFWICPL